MGTPLDRATATIGDARKPWFISQRLFELNLQTLVTASH
jgi:hypothetical protein